MGLLNVRVKRLRPVSLADAVVLLFLVAVVYALMGLAEAWSGPYRPATEIHLTPAALIRYSLLSLSRVALAYFLSLLFTLVYGYLAAKSRRLEPVLISILDILQSVPVLGFMPGLVLTLVGLFPDSNVGLELAAILMIWSGQAWNMVFSFYSSLKSVPGEWRDMARLLRLSPLQVLRSVELPYAANGLLWNSMLSVAGGWFFLMTIESFSLGDRSFRLPGIGSFMAVAHEERAWGAVVAGIIMMFALIILVDRCIWAPLVVWSERFKFQARRPDEEPPRSVVLELLLRSDLLANYFQAMEDLKERLARRRDERAKIEGSAPIRQRWRGRPALRRAVQVAALVLALGAFLYGTAKFYQFVAATELSSWLTLLVNTGFTLVRVVLAVVLGSLWAVPVGVFIGTQPRWTRRLQPVVQIVAAFPFPMMFPLIALGMNELGLPLGVGSVVLLLLSSQWYILFNVISGASAISTSLMDLAASFRIRGREYWRAIVLPGIFPSLVNGWVTAAGGAWNACIVAEYVRIGTGVEKTTGIGASITVAAEAADFPLLASAITMLVVTVVLINRFVWGGLFHRAETRYRMEV